MDELSSVGRIELPGAGDGEFGTDAASVGGAIGSVRCSVADQSRTEGRTDMDASYWDDPAPCDISRAAAGDRAVAAGGEFTCSVLASSQVAPAGLSSNFRQTFRAHLRKVSDNLRSSQVPPTAGRR